MSQPIILILGTRPEAIKLLPVYFALQHVDLPVLLCSTKQHTELLQEVFELFAVKPDYNLNIMQPNQDLFHITQTVLEKVKAVFKKENPSLVLVQGDTTSSMAAALAAFYLHIPIAHVEAGLRTHDIHNPFPEEMNRRFISLIARYHFAPTSVATAHLLAEGINHESIYCTGNTAVDALRIIREKIEAHECPIDPQIKKLVFRIQQEQKQLVLFTTHRRESFGTKLQQSLSTLKKFALENPDIQFIYPYHPNPHVLQAIKKIGLKKISSIYLTKPIAYKELVYILLHSSWVITDSGGIQEEAISLGKPTLVLREKTERMEGIWAGLATLVGTDPKIIYQHMNRLAHKKSFASKKESTVYGDGFAAHKIASIIQQIIISPHVKVMNQKIKNA